MTDTEINVAIAQALGYEIGNISSSPTPSYCLVGKDGEHWQVHEYAKIPDYCHDLNAMHSAEMNIPSDKRDDYCYYLSLGAHVWTKPEPPPDIHPFIFVTRDARQRAKAFLRTLGKWRD